MRSYSIEDLYPVLSLNNGVLLSKNGSITLGFSVEQPECYSLDCESIDFRLKEFFRAFKPMSDKTIIHKQDIYISKYFDSSIIKGDSFLQTADRRFFDKQKYFEHKCFLFFSIERLSSLSSAYIKNPLSYKSSLAKDDLSRLSVFVDDVENAITILGNLPNTAIKQLSEEDFREYIYMYTNGLKDDDNSFSDVFFEDRVKINEKRGRIYSFCDSFYLPDTLESTVKDESISNANSSLYCSLLECLGMHLKYSHVVNQYWRFNKAFKAELSHKVRLFGQYRNFDKEIEHERKQLEDLETEIVSEGNIICENHYNIYLLEDENVFDKADEEIRQKLKLLDFRYYVPAFDNLREMFFSSIGGNASKLRSDFWFLSDLQSSLCLTVHQSTFKQDERGIFFNERIDNVPCLIDTWNGRKGYKLPARNSVVIASTGGGKSVTTLSIVQQNIEQGNKTVVVEFGKSFYQLTQMYNNISLHIDYDENTPLGINPFHLSNGRLTNDKINTLVNLILKFWRITAIKEDDNQVVALRDLLQHYYKNVSYNHSFEGFYNYIKSNYEKIVLELNLNKAYFDYDSFIHVCKEFCTGGYYENVCKASSLGDIIAEKDFIVFELTKIKKDPFLVSVIMSIILDVIETKLLDRNTRGLLVFDEYAETQTLKDKDNSIHATVAFCYQKLRKENSAVLIVLQSPAQLSDDEYSKGIIANTQILYVLPTTETVYNSIIRTFEISNKSHIDLMKSQRNNFEGENKYSEVFIRMGDLYAVVVRLKLSPEKFYTYQTDGETWAELQTSAKEIGIKQAIINRINKNKDEKTNSNIRF